MNDLLNASRRDRFLSSLFPFLAGVGLGYAFVALIGLAARMDALSQSDLATVEASPMAATPVGDYAAEQQIMELPEDGEVWDTTVFVHSNWKQLKADRELVAAFETDPRLRSLKAQTKYHFFTSDQAIYRERFAKHVPTLPAVLVQRANGQVVFKLSAGNITPSALGVQVAEQIYQYRCDNGYCTPVPRPAPAQPNFTPPPVNPRAGRLLERLRDEAIPDILPVGRWWNVYTLATDARTWAALAAFVALAVWHKRSTAAGLHRPARRRASSAKPRRK